MITSDGERHESADHAVGARTSASGLTDVELEALDEAYERTTAKTWTAIRAACEGDTKYSELLQRYSHGDEAPPRLRVAVCSRVLLPMDQLEARRALAYVTDLRAAGAGISRARSDQQRAIFALTTASATLFDELTVTIGRERAIRAIDNGVGCIDETVYDVHDPVSSEPI